MYSIYYSIPYLFIFFIFLILSFRVTPISIGNTTNNIELSFKYVRFLIFPAIFLIFFGFRGYIYTDWVSYVTFYNKCPTFFSGTESIKFFLTKSMYAIVGWEKGFILLSIFLKSITFTYFTWQFLLVFIDFIILIRFIHNYLYNNVIFGMVLFFIYGGIVLEFNLLRNSKAIMLFLLSIPYLEKRKFFPYFTINLIGIFFHVSAIIYIPLYFVLNKDFNRKIILFMFFLGSILFILRFHFLNSLLTPLLDAFHLGRISKSVKNYLLGQPYTLTFSFLQRIIEFLFVFFIVNKVLPYKKYKIFYNSFYLYHFIYLFMYESLVFVERFPILFIFSYWILIGNYYKFVNRNKKLFCIFFISSIALLTLVKGNSRIICLYDNYLFGYKTYNERLDLLNEFYKGK